MYMLTSYNEIQWQFVQSGSEGGWPEPSVTAREGKGCKGKCTEGKILTI